MLIAKVIGFFVLFIAIKNTSMYSSGMNEEPIKGTCISSGYDYNVIFTNSIKKDVLRYFIYENGEINELKYLHYLTIKPLDIPTVQFYKYINFTSDNSTSNNSVFTSKTHVYNVEISDEFLQKIKTSWIILQHANQHNYVQSKLLSPIKDIYEAKRNLEELKQQAKEEAMIKIQAYSLILDQQEFVEPIICYRPKHGIYRDILYTNKKSFLSISLLLIFLQYFSGFFCCGIE
jgi:hypothetical protein